MARQFTNQREQQSYYLLLDCVRNTYAQREPHFSRSDDAAEEKLNEICALFGRDVDDVIRIFHKASLPAATLTKAETALLNEMSHPTFLDLHPQYMAWRGAIFLNDGSGLTLQLDQAGDEDAMYLFHSISEAAKRVALRGLDLDDPRFQDDAALLHELRNRIFSADLATQGLVSEIPQPLVPFDVENRARNSNFYAQDSRSSSREILAAQAIARKNYTVRLVQGFKKLDRRGLKILQTERQEDIDFAYQTASALRGLIVLHGVQGRVTPIDIINNYQASGVVKDPLILAWSKKITEDEFEAEPQSLLHYWANTPANAKPADDRVIRAILARMDVINPNTRLMDIRAFNIPQLAAALEVSQVDLREFMFSEKPEGFAWKPNKEANDGTWVPATNGVFEKLWVFLGYDKPEDFLPQPERTAPIKIKSAADEVAKPVVAVDEYAKAKQLFGDIDVLVASTVLMINPDAENKVRVENELREALKYPGHVVRKDGLPSLPHLWLMWAHDEKSLTRTSPSATFAALAKTFDVELNADDRAKAMAKTAYGSFIWGAVNIAREGKSQIGNYGDFLKLTGFQDVTGAKKDKLEGVNPNRAAKVDGSLVELRGFLDGLDAQEALKNKRDLQLADYMKGAAEKLGVPLAAFLGPVHAGSRIAAKLRAAPAAPR